ncbi:hypothetical protein DPH57_21690 [Massilia sp. YMA4]|nr:hypothetical protein DPH57_21690 [Massilia sp. YMA4]
MDEFLDATTKSNIPQATRRVFFTFTEASIEERGFYNADQLSGMGSGILLRYRSRYFLLTAYHVVVHTLAVQQNESPFMLHARASSPGRIPELYDLLLPRWHWDIRTLMPESHGETAWNDVALIELFDPLCSIPDNEVIDLDRIQVLQRREFFDGQMLIASGYPLQRNGYEYGGPDEFGPGLAQLTTIQRHHTPGAVVRGLGRNDFYFKPSDPAVNHDALNGMSGGSVVNLYPQARKTKWAGMLKAVDERTGLVQFIPAWVIVPIIRRYAEAQRRDLDPNAGAPCVGITPKQREEVQRFLSHVASLR